MPIYEVEAPDGKILEIEGPEGASQESILAYAKNIAYPQYLKQQQESEKEASPALRAAADVPLSLARGATTGVKMISDFFGADNPVSQNLQSVDTYLADLMSAQSKKDAKEVSRIMAEAQDKGVWEQVKAGVKALSVAPIDILTNAFGTAAPTIVAGLAASALAPEAAVGAGLLTAGNIARGAVGAVSGAGTIKGTIYNDVKQALIDQKVPVDIAEETAVKAQSYDGKNLDSILAGGVIGTVASVTGLEPSAVKGILGRIITRSATKEVGKEAAETAAEKITAGAIAKGAAEEAAPEAVQAGQEQAASNIALQREGMNVPTMRGVAGAAALEGVVGGILGGAAKKFEKPSVDVARQDEDAALTEALDTFNRFQKSKGLGPILQIEDQPGNRLLAFARENREKIPVLGQILDSGIARDVKIEQIKKRLSELPQYGAPTETAIEGRVALPSPSEAGVVTTAPEAFATAMKANVPMTNLRVSQGPEGFRVVNENGEVITQQVKTEREANVLLEALRREQDVRNTGVYQQDVKAYEKERLPVVTEAVARAAREVQTPITGYPMKDVKAVDEGLYNAVRDLRNGRNLKADVTPEEIAQLAPSEAVVNELVLKQKPVTGGGATIRPEYETEILGPRPSAPAQEARTGQRLEEETGTKATTARDRLRFEAPPVVTQTQPLSQFEQPKMVTLYKGEGMADVGNMERWTTDKESARRFGRIREVTLPQEVVNRTSAAYSGAPKTDLLFDKRGRTPMELARTYTQPEGIEQEYSAVSEEDMARAPKKGAAAKKPAKKAAKPREVIQNAILQGEGEAPAAGFRPAEGKQPRQKRETYPEIPSTVEKPSDEALAKAFEVIYGRINKVRAQGRQGEKIADALNEALDSGEFTTQQMVIAFQMADITARLLGSTAAAPHDVKFFNKIIEYRGGAAYGMRVIPRDLLNGMVKLATVPDAITKGRNTAAHEAFHVLQDLFNEYDKPAARIIRDAFRGAMTVDDVSPDLLRKLRSLRDPDTGKTYDEIVRDNIGKLYENASPQKRERELQAYVFAALDDARSKGVSVQNFGGAFTRLLNFIADFKVRLNNYLKNQGFRNVTDVFERISQGEQQTGLGEENVPSGSRVIQRGKYEPEDLAGTDDISQAAVDDINATGQGPAAKANSNTYTKTWDKVREFFNPFALVTNQKLLFEFRNRMYGKIGMSEKAARRTSDAIAKANSKDRDAVYKYLTTRNADSKTIVDPKVRAAAEEAKKAINKIGQELVDQKFMTQDSYDTFYDQYLPRIYLYHEMTGRGMTTPLGGVSKMEYIMKRKDLSKEERDLLGEIKDPAFLAYVAMARPARDLAMSEYLTNLSVYSGVGDQGKPWVLKGSTVEWNGTKMTPYALLSEAEDIRKFVLPVAEQHDKEQARSILANVNKMEKIARAGLADIGVLEKSFDTELYAQMPKDKRYGNLAGAIIQKGIYNDLVGTFIPFQVDNKPLLMRLMGDENSALGKGIGLWKLGKTTLNIPTQFRNFMSNMISLTLFTDISLIRLPGLMKRAVKEITSNSQNWRDAQEFGIGGGTMSSAELRGIFEKTLQRINKYDDNKNDNPLIKAYAMTRMAASTVMETAGDVYQASEVLFKFMAYLNERQKQGFVRKPALMSEAVNVANDALFDYTLVNPNIRWVRNAPLGLPFITYYYKVLPKLIETAYKHPMRFAPYIAMATALPLYTMAELDLTPDELESMRKTLPEYIRNNGSVYFLPYRDKEGNIAYVDLAPFFPWSSIIDPFLKMFKGDVTGGAKDVLKPVTPGGPVVTVVSALSTGNDPFTNKPIMDPRDTPTAQALSMIAYVWNQGMPPMFSVNLNDMDQSAGALPRVYNSLFADGTGTDKRGLPRPDDALTAARLLGFNATPLKADMQRAANMNYMLSQIRKRESYRAEIAKDQSMTPEKRQAKIQSINEQIVTDYEKFRKYAEETSAATDVAQRLRESVKEEQ